MLRFLADVIVVMCAALALWIAFHMLRAVLL